uniref:RING-CH-type domain-containing protein n=1 Tax=Salix viminalis TaxID=40686 RepID=A0A6N2L1Z0_SALVM
MMRTDREKPVNEGEQGVGVCSSQEAADKEETEIKNQPSSSKCKQQTAIHLGPANVVYEVDGDSDRAAMLVEHSIGIVEETDTSQNWKRRNLFLEIPSRTLEDSSQDSVVIRMPPTPSPTPRKVNFRPTSSSVDARAGGSPGPSSSKGKSSLKSLLPKLSFKSRISTLDIEKAAIPPPHASSILREKPSISRSFSLTKIFTPRMKQTSSLPVTPVANSKAESARGGNVGGMLNSSMSLKGTQRQMSRSLSVPVNNKERSIKRVDSFFRMITSTPRVKEGDTITNASPSVDPESNDVDGEDIPEEEAVERPLRWSAAAKVNLLWPHQECAVKWFSIKGNKICDVCKQEVQNLPVTLLRMQGVCARTTGASRAHQEYVNGSRQVNFWVWPEVPVLAIVSILAYFCFLEQLLVGKMGTGAIAISLPFSFVLGLLSSLFSSTMVNRRFVWVYASVQFSLIVLFAHIFYTLFNVQAVLAILLATFSGFGVPMSGSSILVELLRWRRRWYEHGQQHSSQVITGSGPFQTAVNSSTRGHHNFQQNEVENPETLRGS